MDMETEQTKQMQLQALIFLCTITVASSDILPGSALHASEPARAWPSPNNTFSLGFAPTKPTTNPPTFVAAITYSGGVIVWSAGHGATVDSTGSLQFLPSGNLCLVSGSGIVIWESNTADHGVSSASLDDFGSFSLKTGNVSVWSSFQNPTDTVLPGQNFSAGMVLRSGSYSFTLLGTGNLTLTWNDSTVYWNRGVNSSVDGDPWKISNPRQVLNFSVKLSSPTLGLQSIGILSVSDPMLESPAIMAYSSDYVEGRDMFRFLRLNGDGNLGIYSSARGSGTATMTWAAVPDRCQLFGYCGHMGICYYSEYDYEPSCECPSKNFEPVDENDSRKGCKRKVEIRDCPGNYTMLELNHTQFLQFPAQDPAEASGSQEVFAASSSSCQMHCFGSNSCVASTSMNDGTRHCYIKSLGFLGGYSALMLPSTSYLKVCGPVLWNSPNNGKTKSNYSRLSVSVLILLVLASLLGFLMFQGGLWLWCRGNGAKFGRPLPCYALLEYASSMPVQFSFKEIRRSTNGFKDRIGAAAAGGFGVYYKGTLTNGTVIAVKRLEGIERGEKEFRVEATKICCTHHLNLVRLIGFCSERTNRLLVHEFMKNGSLDSFLFTAKENPGKLLSWNKRFAIAIGVARGIRYLHEECQEPVIHGDIKPENILLDESYNARVSDFGLAKLLSPGDNTGPASPSIGGTGGYLAPEQLANQPATPKSDVYSFGLVLLETVGGRRNFEVLAGTDGRKFSEWAREEHGKGNARGIIDERLLEDDWNAADFDQARRVVAVSFRCAQEQPSLRPRMGRVVQMLEGAMEVERPPPPPSPKSADELCLFLT
ncbi:LOW QUALITY PROTEIN: G-type lectin S-receptor-like serine/threonine-protein kinase At1g34300 [Rhodamnia argentea]|uniref:Receptor-like serine/threonine-protein kinase n=1 Tax=Rhodamnia argentea TaxID=178133 RepID=A0A8B8QWX8_9MYRT|nr:LOW QUALITY PROTEIN: G-type lectin S-receptor-like serine/threonine-protein kinase At1g34300 [Rhodamnia argentea]